MNLLYIMIVVILSGCATFEDGKTVNPAFPFILDENNQVAEVCTPINIFVYVCVEQEK